MDAGATTAHRRSLGVGFLSVASAVRITAYSDNNNNSNNSNKNNSSNNNNNNNRNNNKSNNNNKNNNSVGFNPD